MACFMMSIQPLNVAFKYNIVGNIIKAMHLGQDTRVAIGLQVRLVKS